jgi:hypothetical protein
MAQQNVEIVRLMWAGLNEEGTSWLALFDERYEIRHPAEFPSQAVSAAPRGVRIG